MRRFPIHLFLALGLLAACGQQKEKAPSPPRGTDEVSALPRNSFPYRIEIKYAQSFEVQYRDNYKIVRTGAELHSWKGEEARPLRETLVLVQRGTPHPPLEEEPAGASVIEVPVRTVAVNHENTEVFLRELGLTDRLVAVGGLVSYDDSIRQAAADGRLGKVNYSWHQPPNLEVMLDRDPDLFLMTISNLDFAESIEKCRALNIPTAPVLNWSEADYLARAEWIKYFALFFNAEQRAEQVFNRIERRIDSLKRIVTERVAERPTIVWGYYAGKDRWIIHRNSVASQFLEDAGLNNVFADPDAPFRNSGEEISSEWLLEQAKDAENWIIGDVHSAALPPDRFMQSFRSWRNDRLFHNMVRRKPEVNAFDWYGTAPVRPDIVLSDLVRLFHPEMLPEYRPYFLGHFDKETMKLPLEKSDELY